MISVRAFVYIAGFTWLALVKITNGTYLQNSELWQSFEEHEFQ
jgi:hypothetical protein